MSPIILQDADALRPVVERVLAGLAVRLDLLLPGVRIEHIGATAIPGALTKGDLDVALRLPAAQFAGAVAALKRDFPMRQVENWAPDFASFGDDATYELPVGIQVVIENSPSDFLVYLRDHLIAHTDALAVYNALKVAHAPRGPDAYWKAKNEFFAPILEARTA